MDVLNNCENPVVKTFFEKVTCTLTYVVYDPDSKDCIVIDTVMNYKPGPSVYSFESVSELEEFIKSLNLKLHYILETHAHADHLTGAQVLKARFTKAQVGIGKNIVKVQELFKNVFNLQNLKTDGSQFDILLDEESILDAGTLKVETLFTPGHTPACVTYKIGNAIFTGDALFMPDFGTGRCDFPAGSAGDLYDSIHGKLYELPDETRVFVGHDYMPEGRDLEFESTIGEEKAKNIQLKWETSKEEFIKFRSERDSLLDAPKLLLPSIQVNIMAGDLPPAEENGIKYLKIPLRSK